MFAARGALPPPQSFAHLTTWHQLLEAEFVHADDFIAAANAVAAAQRDHEHSRAQTSAQGAAAGSEAGPLLSLASLMQVASPVERANGRGGTYMPKSFLTLECALAPACPRTIKARESDHGTWQMRPWKENTGGRGAGKRGRTQQQQLKGAISVVDCVHDPDAQRELERKTLKRRRAASSRSVSPGSASFARAAAAAPALATAVAHAPTSASYAHASSGFSQPPSSLITTAVRALAQSHGVGVSVSSPSSPTSPPLLSPFDRAPRAHTVEPEANAHLEGRASIDGLPSGEYVDQQGRIFSFETLGADALTDPVLLESLGADQDTRSHHSMFDLDPYATALERFAAVSPPSHSSSAIHLGTTSAPLSHLPASYHQDEHQLDAATLFHAPDRGVPGGTVNTASLGLMHHMPYQHQQLHSGNGALNVTLAALARQPHHGAMSSAGPHGHLHALSNDATTSTFVATPSASSTTSSAITSLASALSPALPALSDTTTPPAPASAASTTAGATVTSSPAATVPQHQPSAFAGSSDDAPKTTAVPQQPPVKRKRGRPRKDDVTAPSYVKKLAAAAAGGTADGSAPAHGTESDTTRARGRRGAAARKQASASVSVNPSAAASRAASPDVQDDTWTTHRERSATQETLPDTQASAVSRGVSPQDHTAIPPQVFAASPLQTMWATFLRALDPVGRLLPLVDPLSASGIDPGAMLLWSAEDAREFVAIECAAVPPGVRMHFVVLFKNAGARTWHALTGSGNTAEPEASSGSAAQTHFAPLALNTSGISFGSLSQSPLSSTFNSPTMPPRFDNSGEAGHSEVASGVLYTPHNNAPFRK